MPTRLCLEPRCPHPASYRGRCASHSRARERTTHPNKSIYNSAKHRNTRKRQLFEYPLCAECGAIATDLDHVVPIEAGGAVWDRANHQSLCGPCHAAKTRREQATR